MTRTVPVQIDRRLWGGLLQAFERSLPATLTETERRAVLGSGYGLAHAISSCTGEAVASALGRTQPTIVYQVRLTE